MPASFTGIQEMGCRTSPHVATNAGWLTVNSFLLHGFRLHPIPYLLLIHFLLCGLFLQIPLGRIGIFMRILLRLLHENYSLVSMYTKLTVVLPDDHNRS